MDVDYPRKRGGVRRSIVLVMELAPGGELFDYMFHTGSFPERVARAYVKPKKNMRITCKVEGCIHHTIISQH